MSQQTLSRFFSIKNKEKVRQDNPENEVTAVAKQNNYKSPSSKLQDFAYTSSKSLLSTIPKKRTIENLKIENATKILKKSKGLTEFEQQILDFKLKHMDKILFIQSGYRYKLFGEDAKIASKILNIKLIDGKLSYDIEKPAKNDYLFTTFAQASIPVERLLIHIRRLIVKGYKVGVVDQIETASIREETKSKARVFDRSLSHVYSAGTFINDEDLEKNVTGKSILSIRESKNGKIFLVSVNVYFRDVIYDSFNDDFTRYNLESRLHHLEPIEIITVGPISEETLTCISNFRKYNESNTTNISLLQLDIKNMNKSQLLDEIRNELNISDNDILLFFMNIDNELLECFNKVIQTLKEFNLNSVFDYIDNFKKFSDINDNTILDASVIKNLELFNNHTTNSEKGSLFEILDYTTTKFGQRMLKYWIQRPLIVKESIVERHDAVESIINKMNGLQIERVKSVLKSCPDLELILSRIHYGRTNRKEVYLFLKNINEILSMFNSLRDELTSLATLNSSLLYSTFDSLKKISQNELLQFQNLLTMVNSPAALDTKSSDHITGYFNYNFFNYERLQIEKTEIDKIHNLLDEELENIKTLTKNRDLQFMKVNNEPYLIQIRKSNVKNVPTDWIRINATLNCVRFRSPETVKLYKKLKYHEDMLRLVCNELFGEFTTKINLFYPYLTKLIKKLGEFDALISLAIAAINNNFTKPKIVDIPTIQLKNARNPITEKLLKNKVTNGTNSQGEYSAPSSYIENDFNMQKNLETDQSRIALITGPNMGGKSSFIRQVGLIVILSQIGSFIPCNEYSTLGIFANVCIRLGSNDSIFTGKSTFQVELTECHRILQTCIDRGKDDNLPKIGKAGNSLILMDELGRGTSTIDGCSIAWAVLDYLINDMSKNVITLFVTHFKELDVFEKISSEIVKNYHMGYKIQKSNNQSSNVDDITFTYKILPGTSNGSYGVYCAKIAGMPNEIINKANEISIDVETKSFKRDFDKIMNIINTKDAEKIYNITDLL
ncbi:Mismatch repair protein msh3 [Pichia californica]|nr:Mismatch repair protein msh3 [[Candida] californica]